MWPYFSKTTSCQLETWVRISIEWAIGNLTSETETSQRLQFIWCIVWWSWLRLIIKSYQAYRLENTFWESESISNQIFKNSSLCNCNKNEMIELFSFNGLWIGWHHTFANNYRELFFLLIYNIMNNKLREYNLHWVWSWNFIFIIILLFIDLAFYNQFFNNISKWSKISSE